MFDSPIRLFFLSLFGLWLSAQIGASVQRWRTLEENQREDFNVVQAATLTLLSLIIGFSFSLAINRYEQRKNYEETEANAIGTEYVRAGLLPAADATGVRGLLRKYLDLRILFYRTRDEDDLRKIAAGTAQVQAEMWSTVQVSGTAHASPVVALAVSGMNDVLNSQGYTQASYWNRIPYAAWSLMISIAICCHLVLGYGSRKAEAGTGQFFFVMPLVVSISFLLIADIDSPRRGFINVVPQNLISLSQSLPRQ
jgi:hypothetical protein